MRYVMRQKLLSWGDDYVIRDEQDRERLLVDGKAISWGGQLSFRDPTAASSRSSSRRCSSSRPTYEIYRNGELAAVVKKELFALLHHRFTVDVPGPDDLEAKGDFLDHEYVFTRGGREVATRLEALVRVGRHLRGGGRRWRG